MGKINEWLGSGKTLLGFIGGVATFVLVVVTALSDGLQWQADLQTIGAGLSALLVVLGLAHKAERILGFLKK